MKETLYPESQAGTSWASGGEAARVPNTSMLPGSERPPSPAVRLLKRAVQQAHDAIDRLAGQAMPAARRLGETVSAAEDALHARKGQLRETGEGWTEGVRSTVRDNPLASIAAALALGALIARLSR